MIQVSAKTKKPGALKLYNQINTYLFEQEFGELKGNQAVVNKLKEVKTELSKII